MDKETYNGWTNYATWRVGLEWFDDDRNLKWVKECLNQETYEVAQRIQSHVRDEIDKQSPVDFKTGESSFANSYAHAFLDDVNWFEIAEHLKALHKEV